MVDLAVLCFARRLIPEANDARHVSDDALSVLPLYVRYLRFVFA